MPSLVGSEMCIRDSPQWHQVGSRGMLLQPAISALRTTATTGVIVVLEGGDLPRVADLRGPPLLRMQHQASKNNPGSSGSGSVERLHNGLCRWMRVPQTASAPVAAPAVPSATAPGAMSAAAPGVSSQNRWSTGWSSYPPAVPFESSGASPLAELARPWRQVGITAPRNADEVPVNSRTSTLPLSCACLANARGEPLHVEPSWTRALISRVCRCRTWK